ncbi:MAG: SDR family oxidoreductase [Alphaproteobacteria bacterium]|nr:SDR family oxidoreductase [Alphaproteobacteria bacterium]
MADSKIAIVTGASAGIGKKTALALLADGWSVALAGRRADALQAAIVEAGADGARALAVPTDVSDPASVKALFDTAVANFGRLDLVFNNAGQNAPGVPLEELTDAQWRTVVDVNLTGVLWCIREAFRVMKAQSPMGGRIINNGSISAHTPRPDSSPYTATKHAVTGLTKTAALDGRKYDIAVGQIDIGNAETEMAARMRSGVKQADGEIKPEAMMDVGEVARAVVHMASLPLDANILTLTVMATKMPFVGRG